MSAQDIYAEVGKRYSAAAEGVEAQYASSVAKAFGYSVEELSDIPQSANLGLSCGNPLAMATLREGETVVDLGSGAGFDVFLAANKVGPKGRVIGVDMNEDMLRKAEELKASSGKHNVEFVKSQITHIALEDGIADCIISNCVVNLAPEEEKQLVFNEIFRLLKPGGRVAISDILAKSALPEKIRKSMALYVGCIAGASQVGMYRKYLREAGFHGVVIQDTGNDLNVYHRTAVGDSASDGTARDAYDRGQEASCCAKGCSSATEDDLIIKDVDFNKWTGR
ncbi:NAD(P)-binding protein [Trichoderma citrinoviride]|uniref:Arsenite methyltransferase n=1 Tax=Trichoderma citrinoviride TaxID=58853 RepID=A0A2T4AYI6_9HYPO|nr:NAD(P)-binding protein [Trichoderma citrinoviride]PTB62133.1 NAD(P)-binding protein [Trichoderma citrinoviride]